VSINRHQHHQPKQQHYYYYYLYYFLRGIRYFFLLLHPLLLRDAVLEPRTFWIRPIIVTRMTTRNREQTLAFRYLPFARAFCFFPFAVWHPCVLLFFLPCSPSRSRWFRRLLLRLSRPVCTSLDTGSKMGLNVIHSEDQPIWATHFPGYLDLPPIELLKGQPSWSANG
jgi:hypothetical protein